MAFDVFEDFFDFRFGPFHMGRFSRPFQVGYERTSKTHIVKLKLRSDVTKEDLKVRLQEGGIVEIEWPRSSTGEEIPID